MKRILIYSAIVLYMVFLCPASLNADLSAMHYSVIKTAFMNGYVQVIKYDLEKLKFLKENSVEMKNQLEEDVEQYMIKVVDLNRTDIVKRKRKDSDHSGTTYDSKGW